MGSKWPKFLAGCIVCKRCWPEAQHRSRGLCSRCYATIKEEGILDEFPKIPEDLCDTKYDLLCSDPRAFVIDICSVVHANQFSDDDIEAEGWRILKGMVRRWRGDHVELFESASVEDILGNQAPDYDDDLAMASVQPATAVPSDPWWRTVRDRWLGELTRFSARYGIGPPSFNRFDKKVRFTWGDRYNWVRVVVRAEGDPMILVENEFSGRVRHEFTFPQLRSALLDLAQPVTIRDIEARDD